MPSGQKTMTASALPLRDRITIWGGLGAITLLAWLYLARMPMAGGTAGGIGMTMATAHPWSAADMWLAFVMWAVMMVAMMVPTAAPMIQMCARIARSREQSSPSAAYLFASGYVVVWTVFSAGATIAQYALQRVALMSDTLSLAPIAGGAVLAAAGIYQLTPLKSACLSRCRSPIGFFMTEWREGPAGALWMGLKHGAFCVGCCWMLMAILFVAEAMNLVWVAAITVFVLLEKVAPYGKAIAGTAGVALIASGIWIAVLG
jgi:predicted metal-binding membrane protein